MLIKTVKNFDKGYITEIESQSIPDGASSDVLNWEFKGDTTRIRRGMLRIQATANGAGKIHGIITVTKADGTEVTFWKRGRKLEYTVDNGTTILENGTNIFPLAAEDDEMLFTEYKTSHGHQMFFSSPNSSLYKIMTANPDSYTTMYDSTKNFKGYINIYLNRMFLWGRNADKVNIYGSYIDSLNETTVTNEVFDTGDGGKTYAGTLAFKAAGAKRTCFAVVVNDEDSNEVFTDNYDGTLTGSAGGTGTINYTSGVVAVTFNANVTAGKEIRATYQWEDSTDEGIADFTFSATRLAGEGFIFYQSTGGNLNTVKTYNDQQYCLHENQMWRLNIGVDDTEATNRIFRENAGCASLRGAVSTGDGIWYADNNEAGNPEIRLLAVSGGSTDVIPISKSDNLDLSSYTFNKAVLFEFDRKILVACRTTTENNYLFSYDKKWKTWTRHDYFVNCLALNNGALWAGDTITANIFELFSGLDEDGATINNYIVFNLDELEMEELKKCKKFVVEGLIGSPQNMKVSVAVDNGDFAEVGTMNWNDSQVDRGTSIAVGNQVVGVDPVGGGTILTAYHFLKEFSLRLGKFKEIEVRIEGLDVGWLEISNYTYKDIRRKAMRIPTKYRA